MRWSISCAAIAFSAFAWPPAPASIEGRVINALSGEGLRKVTLTIAATNGKDQTLTAQTDENGHFLFSDLAGGTYRLTGERNGFQRREYGNGATLTVSAGQDLKGLSLKLSPNGVLSGRVLDQEGEPMPNLIVSASRSGYVRGKKDWIRAGGAQTNDRGEFRLSGLRAGRYQVCASGLNIGIGLVGITRSEQNDKPDQTYAYTCIGPVEVRMGEDRRGTDIQMAKTTTVRVKGRVRGAPEGKLLILVAVQKNAPNAGPMPGSVALVQQIDSSFELKGLTPGPYLLTVRSATDQATGMAAPMPLEVGDKHLEGVEVVLGGGGTLSGRVTPAPRETAESKHISVTLERVDFPMPDAPSATAADDGKFVMNDFFPGRYRVVVNNLPEDAYVKSIQCDGQELDETGRDLSPGAALDIMLSRSGAQVEGVVLSPDDTPVVGALVALIPGSGHQSYYRSAVADHKGVFKIKGVPPGRYKALAWTEIEAGAFRDPEFVKPFDNQAQHLTLEPEGHSKLKLKAIEVNQ